MPKPSASRSLRASTARLKLALGREHGGIARAGAPAQRRDVGVTPLFHVALREELGRRGEPHHRHAHEHAADDVLRHARVQVGGRGPRGDGRSGRADPQESFSLTCKNS